MAVKFSPGPLPHLLIWLWNIPPLIHHCYQLYGMLPNVSNLSDTQEAYYFLFLMFFLLWLLLVTRKNLIHFSVFILLMHVNTINTTDLLDRLFSSWQKKKMHRKKQSLESFENFSKLSTTNKFHYMADSLSDIQNPLIILPKMISFALSAHALFQVQNGLILPSETASIFTALGSSHIRFQSQPYCLVP